MGLKPVWQFRFEFFEKNGLPKLKPTAQYKENFKNLRFGCARRQVGISGHSFWVPYISYVQVCGVKQYHY